MSPLNRLEQAIERLVEGSAFRLFGGDIQPVEIAKRLVRAMEGQREIGPSGPVAPNRYNVSLSTKDFDRFADRRASLEWELADYVIRAAADRGLRLDRRPVVQISPHPRLGRHQIAVEAKYVDAVPSALEVAEAGQTARLRVGPRPARPLPRIQLHDPAAPAPVVLDRLPFALGRSLDSDHVITDKRVSRDHAVIKEIDGQVCLVDLDSTNGTFVNGQPVRQTVLQPGDTLSLGGYTIKVGLSAAP